MSEVVVDASVAVKWVVSEPLSAQAMRVHGTYDTLAPSLVYAEIASALAKSVARGELDAEDAARKMHDIVLSEVETVPDEHLCVTAIQLAVELRHSAYDCFYLALAQACGLPLVTADRNLAAAARAMSDPVQVWELEHVPL